VLSVFFGVVDTSTRHVMTRVIASCTKPLCSVGLYIHSCTSREQTCKFRPNKDILAHTNYTCIR
jgi:hypothetical protein